MKATYERFIDWFIRRVIAPLYPYVAVTALVVSGLAVWGIAANWNINSDLRALLPAHSEAASAMEEVDARVGSDTALFVVIDSPSKKANRKFARDFSDALLQTDAVSLAHFHNEKKFFRDRQLLYLPKEDLADLRERVAEEIKEAKKKANPLFVSLDSDSDKAKKDAEKLDPEKLRQKHAQAHDRYKEYLESDDGYALTMVVKFGRASSDLMATERLLDMVKSRAEQLDPTAYHPEMTVDYGGGLVSRQKEYSSIVSDIKSSAVFTVLGLLLVIAVYFRRLRAIGLVLTPLVMGVLWTLALAFWFFGELTTVSVFIFAILLGLGIDFSIHLLSGYDEGRLQGREPLEALVECYKGTGRATLLGAATTFMTFVVISFAEFKGLAQFGQIASLGVLLTWVAMLAVLPALVLSFHHLIPHEHDPAKKRVADRVFESLPDRWLRRLMPALVLVAATASGLAGWSLPGVQFEENFRKIGDVHWPWADEKDDGEEEWEDKSPVEKARGWGKYRAEGIADRAAQVRKAIEPETFKKKREQDTLTEKYSTALKGQYSSVPTILLFDDPDQVRRVTRHMRDLKEAGKLETIASITSIYSFMPGSSANQQARMAEIKKLRRLLEREDLSVLSDKNEKRARKLLAKTDVEPFDIYALPDWSKRLFREAGPQGKPAHAGEDFAFEYMIYLVIRGDQMKGKHARKVVRQLEEIRRETNTDFKLASKAKVYVTMLDHIQSGGLKLISVALVLVALFLMLTFGHPVRGLVAMSPLLFGALWMFGAIAWLGIRLDFFNVIIIPVIIGIGVDDGVHFYRHYLDGGRGTVAHTFRWIGAAVVMTSITSAIGFGGLATTGQDGLRSIGHLAITGITTTLLATLLVLPTILELAERFGWSVLLPEENQQDDE